MEDLIDFVIRETALEGARGAPLPRLWHFVQCFLNGTSVHPSARYVPPPPTVAGPEPLPAAADDAATPQLPLAAPARDWTPPLDKPYQTYVWAQLVDEVRGGAGKLRICQVRTVQHRVVSRKSAAQKRRAAVSAEALAHVSAVAAAANDGDDGTLVTTVHEATPLADEDLAMALDALVDKYGEELRLVVPEEHRRTMVVGEGFSIASKQIYSVLEEIVRWRAVGITQAELSKQLGFDPRSTFHYIKTLAAKHRIVKFPVVHRGNYTQLTLAAQFAHLNDAYMATLAGAAKDIANGPSTAGTNPTAPLPAAAATAGPDGAAAGEEDDDLDDLDDDDEDAIRLTETVKCTFLFFNGGTGAATDANGATDAAVAAADHAAGAAADAAARAPETKPGLFAALVRHKLCELLSLAPNQMLVAEDLIHALGLQPAQYPRQRKWFNRTVADLVQRGHVQRVHAPKAEGHGRGFVNCIRLLKPYTLSRRKTMPTLLADDAGDDVVMGESSASAATADAEAPDAATPEAAAAANADTRSPAGILADLPFEYQVHRLLAAAGERGMTGRQLRRHLGNIAARPFNKSMERLIVLPGKPAPPPPPPGAKHTALTLQRMPEIRGRERRYRYYTNEAMLAKQANDPELKALFAAQQEKQMASLVAVRKLALGEGGATATEPATPARGAEGAVGDAMDVDSTTPEVPATPVPASSSTPASVAATPVTLSLRTSLESLRRANAIMALVRQYRIVEINHIFIRQIQDILTAEVPPVMAGAEPAPVAGWQLDKKTVLRSLETLQREKHVELKWIGIPMLSGGMDRKQFAVVVDGANPVTDQEISDKAREVEREILYGPAEPAWISSSARENGGTPSRQAPPVISTPMVPSARMRRRSTRGAAAATPGTAASTPVHPNAAGMTAAAAAAAAADAAPHWRVVATEYGWLDARMLRVKYLYQYLHEQTRDAGPEYAFDITVLFSDMTLGMYLQLIGHIIQSPALTEYMEHHLDTPLRNVRDDIRAELLGTDRLKRRFRFHVTHMINVLVALNVVVAPDEPELYKTVTEMTLPKRIYRVPRQIDLLDYLAPRSERTPVGTRNLTDMTEVAEFWTELELLRAPQTASAGPRSRSSSKGGADDDDPDADVDADDADEPDDDLRRPNRQSVLNPEADPIKLLTLPRNWRPPHTYTREQRRALTAVCDPDHGTTPLQHDPACRELVRKTGLHINRVKQFFRRFEWDWAQKRARQAGAAAGAASGGGGESASARDTALFAWPTRRGASVSPAEPRPASPGTSLIGRLQAKRMQKRAAAGTPTSSSSSAASSPAVGASASTGTAAAAAATKQRTTSGTTGSAPGMPDRRHRKRTLQQINADGDVEVVRQKRTRFQWTETEDARLVASWVICTHQVQQRRARAVAWRLMAHMFSGRPIDSLRRRATALLKRPDVLVRTKVLERVWAAHLDECDECEDVDHHEELERAVTHLLAINIDEAAASAPIVEEIPDSVEDLLAQFEVVADPVPLLVDLVDNELTARSKLVHMYENALYVPQGDPCSRQMILLDDTDGENAGTPTADQEPDEAAADAEVAAVTRPVKRSSRLRSPTRFNLPPAVADRQVAVVAQFLKMICLTPDAEYNSATAFGMLHAYPSHIVERALTQAQDSGALVRMRSATKTRVVPGRTVALSDRFRVQLYGHPTQRQIMAAVQCVTDLGAHIARAGADVQTFTLDELVDEGVMMAVIDLVVGGHAHMRVRVALPTLWAAPIVPAHARDADMHLPVEVSVRREDLPAPQITWPADGQAPVLSTSKRLVRRVRMPDGSVRVRVGQEGHVLVDPTNDEAMAQVCLRRLPDHIAADPELVDEEADEDLPLAAAEAALRKWMVPRIWTSIRGHVVPAIVRSAMTALLSFLVKYPGAPLTWVVERFELCLLKTEIIELLEMLEARGAVETAEVDGEMYVYVLSGYFAKVL